MRGKIRGIKQTALLVIVNLVAFSGHLSAAFTDIVAFGDSLTDEGNIGLFTNSDSTMTQYTGTWVAQLSQMLVASGSLLSDSASIKSTTAGGTDYAYAGAQTQTDIYIIKSMASQVNQYLSAVSQNASSESLYTFWGGGNDIFSASSSTRDAAAATAANNIASQISLLYSKGARTFVWLNMPPLDETPAAGSDVASLASATELYNSTMDAAISSLYADLAGINIIEVDAYGLIEDILASPADYGFTDVDTAAGSTNANIDDYLFVDSRHPTTHGHYELAVEAFNDITLVLTAIPEPGTVSLLVSAGVMFGALRRRRRKV